MPNFGIEFPPQPLCFFWKNFQNRKAPLTFIHQTTFFILFSTIAFIIAFSPSYFQELLFRTGSWQTKVTVSLLFLQALFQLFRHFVNVLFCSTRGGTRRRTSEPAEITNRPFARALFTHISNRASGNDKSLDKSPSPSYSNTVIFSYKRIQLCLQIRSRSLYMLRNLILLKDFQNLADRSTGKRDSRHMVYHDRQALEKLPRLFSFSKKAPTGNHRFPALLHRS